MRASLRLGLTALFSSVAFGFSSSTTTHHHRHHLQHPAARRSTRSGEDGPNTRRHSRNATTKFINPRLAAVKKGDTTSTLGPDFLPSRIVLPVRGGGGEVASSSANGMPQGAGAVLASFWGTAGVLYILAKAIKRVLPIALEPFQEGAVPLNQWQLG